MAGARNGGLRVTLWPESYAVARLRAVPPGLSPAVDGPPVALLAGGGQVSLMAPEAVVDGLAGEVEHATRGWRALTFDSVLPLGAVGVVTAVSRALADVGVPVIVVSSHDTDHVLVPGHLLGRALAALGQVRPDKLPAASR